MLLAVAPSGISEETIAVLGHALALAQAIEKHQAFGLRERELAASNVQSAGKKLVSPVPDLLHTPGEREGLIKLLILAKDMATLAARDARLAHLPSSNLVESELADLRRRAEYPAPGRPRADSKRWKEAS